MANNLADLCIQHGQYVMYRPHLPRYELISPYEIGQFTQQDLNMRRKAEILLYNTQASKGNNLTKSQKWSLLNKTSTKQQINRVCKVSTILTPSSSCDVPGPPIYLYMDDKVPLYNYIKKDNYFNYSSIEKQQEWDYVTTPNVEYKSKIKAECFKIIYNGSATRKTTYSFLTPLALTIQGTKLKAPKLTFTPVDMINIKIINAKCYIFYSGRPILKPPAEIVTLPNFDFTIKLQGVGGDFSASKYIGPLETKGLTLDTQSQFVYTIYLSFDIVTTLYDVNGNVIGGQSDVTIYTEEVVSNLSGAEDEYYFHEHNCNFLTPENPIFVNFELKSDPVNDYVDIPNQFGK